MESILYDIDGKSRLSFSDATKKYNIDNFSILYASKCYIQPKLCAKVVKGTFKEYTKYTLIYHFNNSTQNTIGCLKQYFDSQQSVFCYTQRQIAELYGISLRALTYAIYIQKHYNEFIDPLFNGEHVVIKDNITGKFVTSNKISRVYNICKKNVDLDNANKWSPIDDIESIEGKEWYSKELKVRELNVKKNIKICKILAELANCKFNI